MATLKVADINIMAGRVTKLMPRPGRLVSVRASDLLTRQISTEAESVASRLHKSGLLRTQGLIGGKWVDAYDSKTIEVSNPSTGKVIADVSCMGGRETNDAISSAYDAFYCMEL